MAANLGYQCRRARNGREGVDLVVSSQPDVIVMDLMMPVMDGIAAIREIKALPFVAHLPIILFTFALGDPRIADAIRAGAADVLIKPVAMAQLDRTLRTQMANLAITYVNRGLHSHQQGDLEGALASYDNAVRVNPNEPMAFNNRGSVRRDRGDLEGAITDYSAAIQLKPDYAMAFNNRGVARASQGDLNGAITDYGEALRLQPDNAVAYNNRGTALRYKGDMEGALADYGAALRLKPDFAEARNNRNATCQSLRKK